MLLMNKNTPVLWFDNEDKTIQIIDKDFVPYNMLGVIKGTEDCCSIAEGIRNYDLLRTFLSDRVLLLSRENAKAILQSICNSQKLTEEERVRLAIKCRAVSVSDNFWLKEDNEMISFDEINVRTNHLSDTLFQVSVLGNPISLQHSVFAVDIDTKGMFKKTWLRENGGLYLFKSDNTTEKVNTKAEVCTSEILDLCDFKDHVQYMQKTKEGVYGCICKCFTDDNYSLVEADYVKLYCEHNGIDFNNLIVKYFQSEFANMVVIDYVLMNTDRHINNWGFLINNQTNKIEKFAPLFDFNQALIVLLTHKEAEFEDLIYEPTGLTMRESFENYKRYANIDFEKLRDKVLETEFQDIDKNIELIEKIIQRVNQNKIIKLADFSKEDYCEDISDSNGFDPADDDD